jgi:uncharacterized protein YoxC
MSLKAELEGLYYKLEAYKKSQHSLVLSMQVVTENEIQSLLRELNDTTNKVRALKEDIKQKDRAIVFCDYASSKLSSRQKTL